MVVMSMSKLHKIYGIHTYAIGLLKRLYDWVISWGHTPYGTPALFVLAFVEASFFPLPPDVLLICLCVSNNRRSFWYATVGTVGSVLGGVFGYFIGYAFYETLGKAIVGTLGMQASFEQAGALFAKYGFWTIFGAGFSPIPYKVFTIAAGFWQISLPIFILASIAGRAGRLFIIAFLLFFFGKQLKVFIDKYFNILSLVGFVLMVAGFFAIKLLL